MVSDEWPAIKVERFDGELQADYTARRARIVELLSGFRKGRYLGRVGEAMESELLLLQEPSPQNYSSLLSRTDLARQHA